MTFGSLVGTRNGRRRRRAEQCTRSTPGGVLRVHCAALGFRYANHASTNPDENGGGDLRAAGRPKDRARAARRDGGRVVLSPWVQRGRDRPGDRQGGRDQDDVL